jgi:hypothetical protein
MHDAIGAVQNDYSVEVTLLGKDLEPRTISTILGVEPAEAARNGDRHINGHGDGTYTEGFWSYEISSHDDVVECRDHQINSMIDILEPHLEEIRSAGVEKLYFYYTLSSFTGLMNIRIHAATLARLARIDADLYISCFDCFNPKHPYWKQTPSLQGSNI